MTESRDPRIDVRSLRASLGLTQEQLAQRLGVSFATVNRWEKGRRSPSAASRRRLESLATSAGSAGAGATRYGSEWDRLIVAPTPFIGGNPS